MSQLALDLAKPKSGYPAHTEWLYEDDPPPPHDGMAVSEADYWRHYAEWPEVTCEWHNGRLEIKGVSDWATILLFQWFTGLIRYYLDSHRGGQLTNQELGFSFSLAVRGVNRRSIRRPDTAVILPGNPLWLQPRDRSYRGIFDLCLEALSDSDPKQKARDQVVKYREYAQAGVPEYYILAADLADCAFYRREPQGLYQPILSDQQGIMASTALPGLRWRWDDLTRQPSLNALLADPVYQDYVLPELSLARAEKAAALEQAEQATRRAEQEAQRAEQASARATQLAERLRQLGIDPLA